MEKGLRFQTKLMLILGGTIVGVTLALIAATEAKVRQAYTEQFAHLFDSQVGHLELSREERSREYLELSLALSKHPYIISTLNGNSTGETEKDFWKTYQESMQESGIEEPGRVRPGGAKSGSLSQEILSKIGKLSVVNLEGEETNLFHPKIPEDSRKRMDRFNIQKRGAKDRLEKFMANGEPQILYHPTPTRRPNSKGGRAVVREMVAAPVTDPESGKQIGVFFRGASTETKAQRILEDYQEEFGTSERLMEGIFMDGTIYSSSMEEEIRTGLTEAIAAVVQKREEENRHNGEPFEISVAGNDYLIHLGSLTGEGALRPAYQVAAFPLANLQQNLADLRLRGSGIGAGVLLFALALGWIQARNLSTPLQKLALGTKAIRAGDFNFRVEKRSSDEIGDLADSFNEMAQELKQKAIYRELLGKVSDETVAQALVSGSLDLELGGEIKTTSILFCDIRGFTRMTEDMHPTDVIAMLNEHMTAMTAVVRRHYGVVDKFVGDEIMAVFGGLKSYGNDADLAASCACDMIQERERLNREFGHEIEIGVGVATGEVVAGCMGSIDRLNFTVLGARVNLAARLCGQAGPMEVVVDDNTFAALESHFESEVLSSLRLKGFSEDVSAYRLRSGTAAAIASAT
ncbi:MAG: adenylate/guanylate cyclase domain-containing protein [Verrucomicrobiales bacterium]|nr:adenylate/guanylate cyclase domain-containing protein [Verrucomicrobiales bacterium]